MSTTKASVTGLISGMFALAGVVALAGCDQKPAATAPAAPAPAPAPSIPAQSVNTAKGVMEQIQNNQAAAMNEAEPAKVSGSNITVAGLQMTVPAGWTSIPVSGMRAAEFKTADGASVVFFVGIGGGIQSNIDRWKGQVKPDAGGEPVVANVVVVGKYPASMIKIPGTYAGMSMGGTAGAAQEHTTFVGVALDAPGGPLQIRMTGPAAGMATDLPKFEGMLSNAKAS